MTVNCREDTQPLMAEVCIREQRLHEKRVTRSQAKLSETAPRVLDPDRRLILSRKVPKKEARSRLKKKSFPFLQLPVELRIQIYHDCLTYDHILIRKPKAHRAANFLLVNHLVYSEAFPVFYDVNVFQVHIGGLPSDTETQIANVHYMRQCCLHLEITMKDRSTVRTKLMDKFVADIWNGKMECLLIDVWEPEQWPAGIESLEKLTWGVSQIHLAQVVITQVQKKGGAMRYQDRWCQRLERCMMASRGFRCHDIKIGDDYEASPALGIDLVGDELEKAKREGGWVVQDNDLYVLFGKCSTT
ncbi:MAG: hypothetical protein Q9216_002031 [Gyalolechia sp. 2 TL-2023]